MPAVAPLPSTISPTRMVSTAHRFSPGRQPSPRPVLARKLSMSTSSTAEYHARVVDSSLPRGTRASAGPTRWTTSADVP